MNLLFKATLIILLLLPFSAAAELPAGMQADFAPTGGYIIMPIGDEFLVDLDASSSLQEGDILTLIMPGEKVVHPVTKEVLGTLDLPKGYLQVSRIKSGYSYAKLLFSETAPEKGDQIKRFEQVPTVFVSQNPAEKLFSELENGLPQLNWLKPDSTTEPLLTFELQGNLLSVKNMSGAVLKNYQLVNGQITAPTTRPSGNHNFAVDADPAKNKGLLNRTINKLIDTAGIGGSDKGLPGQLGIIRNQQALKNQGIWMSPALEGEPAGLTVADLDNDGQQETIVAMQNQLQIFQINQEQLIEEARIDLPAASTILNIDVLDQGQQGVEIFVTTTVNDMPASRVLKYSNDGYQTIIDDIPWLLRVVDLPGEGRVLIGQRSRDYTQPFIGKPFRVLRDAEQLQKGAELNLANNINLYGFLPFAAESGGQLTTSLTQDDYLKVTTEGGQKLWESGDYFGGSESKLFEVVEQHGETVAAVYIQKRILRGPEGEILVVQNDGMRTMQRFRMFKDSRVIALNWNGFAMQEIWRTSGMNGYLADFALADADNDGTDELVMAVKFQHKTMMSKARSSIVIYELN